MKKIVVEFPADGLDIHVDANTQLYVYMLSEMSNLAGTFNKLIHVIARNAIDKEENRNN